MCYLSGLTQIRCKITKNVLYTQHFYEKSVLQAEHFCVKIVLQAEHMACFSVFFDKIYPRLRRAVTFEISKQ